MNYLYSYFGTNIDDNTNEIISNEIKNDTKVEEDFILLEEKKELEKKNVIEENPEVLQRINEILDGDFDALIRSVTSNDEQLLYHFFMETDEKKRKKIAKIFKNTRTGSGQSILQLVSGFSSFNWVKYVIKLLTDFEFIDFEINYQDDFGLSPLHYVNNSIYISFIILFRY